MIYLLIFLHFFTGLGIISLLNLTFSFYQKFALSLILGMGIGSFAPFLLTLSGITISGNSIFLLTLVLTIIPLMLFLLKKRDWKSLLSKTDFILHIYEIPFFIIIGYFLFISVWKCYYYPNIPFDTIVGSDMIAKATIAEGSLNNSIYNDFLTTTSTLSNQPYYAPFTLLMQVIYLTFGSLFGKVWLSILVCSFWLFLYFELRHYVHPILAGILTVIAFYSPEMFAYSYLVQTDYANAIFLVVSVTLFNRFLKEDNKSYLVLSSLLFALACWTRTETIFFLPLVGFMIWYKENFMSSLAKTAIFGGVALVFVVLWNYIFLGGMVPKAIPLGEFNFDFSNYFSRLSATVSSMNNMVFNNEYWAYSVQIPLILILINLVLIRKRIEFINLIWPLGIYFIFVFLVMHVVGANVAFTFRRGFFKIIILLYVYLSASGMFKITSDFISKFAKRPINS